MKNIKINLDSLPKEEKKDNIPKYIDANDAIKESKRAAEIARERLNEELAHTMDTVNQNVIIRYRSRLQEAEDSVLRLEEMQSCFDKPISDAIFKLLDEYEYAQAHDYVKKPLAYALYQTWKYFDKVEKQRLKEVNE